MRRPGILVASHPRGGELSDHHYRTQRGSNLLGAKICDERCAPPQAALFLLSAHRRKVTTGGVLLWAGTTSIGASTVVLLAVVSRHMHHRGFAGLSTLFGLLFVASLVPSGIPLRAAALIVDGAQPMRIKGKYFLGLGAIGALFSPLVAYVLHLPVLAVFFVAAQILVALQLAIRRGSLIAYKRFS